MCNNVTRMAAAFIASAILYILLTSLKDFPTVAPHLSCMRNNLILNAADVEQVPA